ncbi:ependymin-like [Salarias fasciatus]|uniref:Ependymin-like n=1 Tax=Salarias fasciatus TaxID=181472 RepID=A0A672GQV2_SALFA|nr:ependymin-like [Salarias fasciatus]
MRALCLLVCLSLGCLAQGPKKCTSPPLLTGSMSVFTQSEKLTAFAKYSYDAIGERILLREFGYFKNESFHFNMLLLFRQGLAYRINYSNRTCCKKQLQSDFHPLAVPKNASLQGQVVLGGSSGPGQGLLVNSWAGEMSLREGTAKYMSSVTEFGCIPVSTLFHTDRTGWIMTSFFNNVIGLVDPQALNPPDFCEDAKLDVEDGPVSFFSFF